MPRNFHIVVAADRNRGIGKDGSLPWKLPGDMAYFKSVTATTKDPNKRNAVIMGRKTWDSIPPRFRPLKDRLNIILTRRPQAFNDAAVAAHSGSGGHQPALLAHDLDEALSLCDSEDVESVFVIGGGAVYEEALNHPRCASIYLTEIDAEFPCDTFLPAFEEQFANKQVQAQQEDGGVRYCFAVYTRTT